MTLELHRIHETFLNLIENNNTGRKQKAHEHETVNKPTPTNKFTGTQETVLEGFKDGRDRVQTHQFMHRYASPLHSFSLAQRIDDRGGIHPKLNQKGKEYLEISILRSHRGDDRAKSQGKASNHQNQDGEEQHEPVKMRSTTGINEIVDNVHQNEEPKLNAKAQEIAHDMGNRHHQAWEVNLSKDIGVFNERVGCLGYAIGKILPQTCSGQIEQRPRYSIRRNSGNTAEHDHIHDDGKRRLNHIPCRAQDRLLILSNNIPLDEQGTQVPIGP